MVNLRMQFHNATMHAPNTNAWSIQIHNCVYCKASTTPAIAENVLNINLKWCKKRTCKTVKLKYKYHIFRLNETIRYITPKSYTKYPQFPDLKAIHDKISLLCMASLSSWEELLTSQNLFLDWNMYKQHIRIYQLHDCYQIWDEQHLFSPTSVSSFSFFFFHNHLFRLLRWPGNIIPYFLPLLESVTCYAEYGRPCHYFCK